MKVWAYLKKLIIYLGEDGTGETKALVQAIEDFQKIPMMPLHVLNALAKRISDDECDADHMTTLLIGLMAGAALVENPEAFKHFSDFMESIQAEKPDMQNHIDIVRRTFTAMGIDPDKIIPDRLARKNKAPESDDDSCLI